MSTSLPVEFENLTLRAAAVLGAHTEAAPGGVRLVYGDGRSLLVALARAGARISVTAELPAHAPAMGIPAPRITVTASPRASAGVSPAEAAAQHLVRHIRRRLEVRHAAALAEMGHLTAPGPGPDAEQAVEEVRTRFAGRTKGQLMTADEPRVHGEPGICAVAWWQAPSGPSKAMAPFLADALRRVGLATTEEHGGARVRFAARPVQVPARGRYRLVGSRDGQRWDVVDVFTGALTNSYADKEWARGMARWMNEEDETARRVGAATFDLAGVAEDLVEVGQVRDLAVDLVAAGHTPHGLAQVDHRLTPGFYIFPGPAREAVTVARMLDPFGGARPGAGLPGTREEIRAYEATVRGYVEAVRRPEREVEVTRFGVQVRWEPGLVLPGAAS